MSTQQADNGSEFLFSHIVHASRDIEERTDVNHSGAHSIPEPQ